MYHRATLSSINILKNIHNNHSSIINFYKQEFHNNTFKSISLSFSSSERYFRQYSTSSEINSEALENVSFDQFKQIIKDKKVVIIDVREPKELIKDGSLPRYINIPLGEVETALKSMSDSEFAKKYGHLKPSKDTPIVFSCLKGQRSLNAQIKALQLDYRNVKNFIGGWSEWTDKTKK